MCIDLKPTYVYCANDIGSNLLVSFSYKSNNASYNLWNNKCFILEYKAWRQLAKAVDIRTGSSRMVATAFAPQSALFVWAGKDCSLWALCLILPMVVRNLCEFIYWCSKLHCFGQKPPKCRRRLRHRHRQRQRRTEYREKSVPSSVPQPRSLVRWYVGWSTMAFFPK